MADWSSWFVFHLCTCTCSNHPDQWSACIRSVIVGLNTAQQSLLWKTFLISTRTNMYAQTHTDTQVEQCLPNRARSLIPASEWPRSPLEETQSTPTLAQAHVYTHTHRKKKKNRAPTPTELKTFIWQHQLTPDTHTVLPWPCSTSRLIKIVAGIRGVGTTGRESHSFCACVCVFLYECVCVCVCVCGGVDETSQRLREGRSGEALTLSILHYWLVSRETVPSGQRQIE